MHVFSSLLSLSFLLSVTIAATTPTIPTTGVTTPPVCNAADKDWSKKTHHAREVLEFVAPGTGACGTLGYRHSTNAACVHSSWIAKNGCGRWIRLKNEANGLTADAQVRDTCGFGDTQFTCDDIRVGRQAFATLAGKDKAAQAAAINAGHLPGKITWEFIDTPCWACYAGLPHSLKTDGSPDPCTGLDFDKNLRCGLKVGKDRVLGPAVADVCKASHTC